MSKLYVELAKNIDKQELIDYYYNHLPSQTIEKFNIPSLYLLKQVLSYFELPKMTNAQITKIQMSTMTDEEKLNRGEKISSSNKNREVSEETRKKISESQKGKPRPYDTTNWKKHSFKKGNIPWNKGKKGLQHWVDGQADRRINTMRKNGNIGKFKTKIESKVEADLINKYGKEHVFYQYKDEKRYPFYCDFYVDTEDLFIEVNSWWHHGTHPYNPNDENDVKRLNELIAKSEQFPENGQWKEAIKIWTVVDPLKIEIAKNNNLNYKMIYKY